MEVCIRIVPTESLAAASLAYCAESCIYCVSCASQNPRNVTSHTNISKSICVAVAAITSGKGYSTATSRAGYLMVVFVFKTNRFFFQSYTFYTEVIVRICTKYI